MRRIMLPLAMLVGFLVATGKGHCQPPGNPNQQYSNGTTPDKWTYFPQKDAYGIWWKYWDTQEKKYKKHLVYWYPKDPNHFYYYDLEKESYWGRYDGTGYSRLPLKYRRKQFKDINPEWFPEPDEMPIMPNSGGLQMKPPPPPPNEEGR